MRNQFVVAAMAACGMTAASMGAAITTSGYAGPYDISARARNGNTGFEAILFNPGADPNTNPSGAPVWNSGTYFQFAVTYVAATGTTSFMIDFNNDGDFLDGGATSLETLTVTNASLAGKSFQYATLRIEGGTNTSGAMGGVDVQNFTINAVNFGQYMTGVSVLEQQFTDSSGQFGDITITGSFDFIGNIASELPRMWISLGDAADLQVVPLPTGAGLAFAGLLGLGVRRRRAL